MTEQESCMDKTTGPYTAPATAFYDGSAVVLELNNGSPLDRPGSVEMTPTQAVDLIAELQAAVRAGGDRRHDSR
jgi:hypothetical protein